MITSLRILIATALLSLVATAAPVGICLHAYGPDAPPEKIECFEYEKVERAGSDYRFFPRADKSVIVTAYRFRSSIPYKPGLAPTHPDFDKLLKLYEETARATPSARAFLNPKILVMRAQVGQVAKQTEKVASLPTITLADGSQLRGCTMRKIEDGSVSIMHQDGISKVSLEELDGTEKKALNATAEDWSLEDPSVTPKDSSGKFAKIVFKNGVLLKDATFKEVSGNDLVFMAAGMSVSVSFDQFPGELAVLGEEVVAALVQTKEEAEPEPTVFDGDFNDPVSSRETATPLLDHTATTTENFDPRIEPEAALIPFCTPWLKIMIPKRFKFSSVEIYPSQTLNAVTVSYNHEGSEAQIPGSAKTGEQAIEMTIYRDADELKNYVWLEDRLSTFRHDTFIEEAQTGDLKIIGDLSYKVSVRKFDDRNGFQMQEFGRHWTALIKAIPTRDALPVVEIRISADTSENLESDTLQVLGALNDMTIRNFAHSDVLLNWENNLKFSRGSNALRPTDETLGLIWSGNPPQALAKASQHFVGGRLSFLLTFDELRLWLGVTNVKKLGDYSIAQYRLPYFRFDTDADGTLSKTPSYCRGAQVTAVFGGVDSRLLAYQYNLYPNCQVARAAPTLKWSIATEDDLRSMMYALAPIILSGEKMVLYAPKVFRKEVPFPYGDKVETHKGLEVYGPPDESFGAAVDFGTVIHKQDEPVTVTSGTNGKRIFVSSHDAAPFLEKYGYDLEVVARSVR